MEITDKVFSELLNEIEKVRRRKIVDYKTEEDIGYIDISNNLEKVQISNNHLIFGRRGSGKTTLILAALKRNTKNVVSAIDIQPIKSDEINNVILKILIQTLSELLKVHHELFSKIEKEYNEQYRGFSGILNYILKKRDKKVEESYIEGSDFCKLIEKEKKLLETMKDIPDEVTYNISQENTTIIKRQQIESNELFHKASLDTAIQINGKYKILQGKIDATLSAMTSKNYKDSFESNNNESSEIIASYVKTLKKSDIIQEQREGIAFIFNEIKRIHNVGVYVYLDDFYQIPIDKQPVIIQYFHDIYKYCANYSFCFKLAALPYRLRMNKTGNVDMSYKDDFSPIKLDNDLSELESTKDYLLSILVNLDSTLDIKKQDIVSLFNNDEVLLYSIIATGGVPRDFLLIFAELINAVRNDNKSSIQKEHIYTVVKSLREDKDNNIEYDTDISPQIIRRSVEIINEEVVGKLNTNVILYPKLLADKHEILLKNLVNLRYFHIIKDSVTSETRKKEEFVAYLVDMSFYAVNKRLRPNFDFRRFWETDNAARLTQLRQSKIWSFPENILDDR